jgi:D-serine deaminase-like pyridoxal phosphate-dependent protein
MKLSEEHGWIKRDDGTCGPVQVGDKVLVVPNHACPVANLADEYVVVHRHAEQSNVERWKVAARGCVQ